MQQSPNINRWFWICVWVKLGQGNIIIEASSYKFGKALFSKYNNVCSRLNAKPAFSNSSFLAGNEAPFSNSPVPNGPGLSAPHSALSEKEDWLAYVRNLANNTDCTLGLSGTNIWGEVLKRGARTLHPFWSCSVYEVEDHKNMITLTRIEI